MSNTDSINVRERKAVHADVVGCIADQPKVPLFLMLLTYTISHLSFANCI